MDSPNQNKANAPLTGIFVRTFHRGGGSISQIIVNTYEEAIATAHKEFEYKINWQPEIDRIEIIDATTIKILAVLRKNYKTGEIGILKENEFLIQPKSEL